MLSHDRFDVVCVYFLSSAQAVELWNALTGGRAGSQSISLVRQVRLRRAAGANVGAWRRGSFLFLINDLLLFPPFLAG